MRTLYNNNFTKTFDSRFKLFHELMSNKVKNILLVSTPYDAWIMEHDCRISERIINEYRGLNLSHPPKLIWISSYKQAINTLDKTLFDMVITMPRQSRSNLNKIIEIIKKKYTNIPIFLLSHDTIASPKYPHIDKALVWSGNTNLLLALIKSTEDQMNVKNDTASAGVRVIIFVEDTPFYLSSLLPILYRELVSQTQAVMEGTLNEEHRLLTMKARPKILVAGNYEGAMFLYEKFEPYVLGVVSDVNFSKNNKMCSSAGISLLKYIKTKRFDIPLLLTSSDPNNLTKAKKISATFVDKNSETLHQDIRQFFKKQLGFGDFIFRMPSGTKISRASNLQSLVEKMTKIPTKSFIYHSKRNDFSRWLFARTEMVLASKIRLFKNNNFKCVKSHRNYLISTIQNRIKRRQKGIVADFDAIDSDFGTEFFKIGKGSLGGKARGLAFITSLLKKHVELQQKYKNVNFIVPQTLVITTDGFESFIDNNNLKSLSKLDSDEKIAKKFINAKFPSWIKKDLRAYLSKIKYPLAIRSSSLLEDAQFSAYAGLYRTYMITNDHPNIEKRLNHLIEAIKRVYASTYFKGPKTFSKRVGHRTEEELMAVIIQKLVGSQYNNFFYPAISGVAQSCNYYPFSYMKPNEGIATIVIGLGKMVAEGERSLRFSPTYPELLPNLSTVNDILKNSQRFFYSLKMEQKCHSLKNNDGANLYRREISNCMNDLPMQLLSSTYFQNEQRIRDTISKHGFPVSTFSSILKHKQFPLTNILKDILKMGKKGMGCAVELEFSVNLQNKKNHNPEFSFLQLRPMAARDQMQTVNITKKEKEKSFCFSTNAIGNTKEQNIYDIIYVKPNEFDPAKTRDMAEKIGEINSILTNKNRKYLLIGPGRWGSVDNWLGIPVNWNDISNVGAIVETINKKLMVEPSQGSHFFHNIISRRINYITISNLTHNFINWDWITSQPITTNSKFIAHLKLTNPITIKVDGKTSNCVIFNATN